MFDTVETTERRPDLFASLQPRDKLTAGFLGHGVVVSGLNVIGYYDNYEFAAIGLAALIGMSSATVGWYELLSGITEDDDRPGFAHERAIMLYTTSYLAGVMWLSLRLSPLYPAALTPLDPALCAATIAVYVFGFVSPLLQVGEMLGHIPIGIELVNQNSVAGNTIFGNGIQRNEGIGIDFIEFELGVGAVRGPTENDPGDADAGANRRMNYPEFGEAAPVPGTDPVQTVVTFVVDSDPANQAYPISVDFYRAPGYGEFTGSSFMASAVYDTFGAVETLTLTLPAGIGIDRHFTAVATDADGNTSEFAPARSLGEVLFRDGYED